MYAEHFPVLQKKVKGKDFLYFDSACTYLKNTATIDGINYYYTHYSCCSGDRESSLLGSALQQEIMQTRKIVLNFIGASQSDFTVFTSGTTDSINKLIFSLDEQKIHAIITSDLEHNSNFLPQREYSKQKGIPFLLFGYQDVLNAGILEEKLKMVPSPFLFCFTHSSNIIGGTFDIAMISHLVHKYGGYVLVDDAQYIAHNQESVVKNGIDFLAFSPHKIGGPTGIGILYIKKGCESILKYSSKVGGGTVKSISDTEVIYKHIPYFLEGGVQDFAGILGLKSCIEFIQVLGIQNIHDYMHTLMNYFWQGYNKNGFLEFFDIVNLSDSFLVTLIPKNFNVIDFHQYCNYFLDDYVISFRTGTMCADNFLNHYLQRNTNVMRLSFGIYNTKDDIDTFFRMLLEYIHKIK